MGMSQKLLVIGFKQVKETSQFNEDFLWKVIMKNTLRKKAKNNFKKDFLS